jgi:quercetin dioxygenase-like cupin family protein/DNA-binding XRE family transcriptional regulator
MLTDADDPSPEVPASTLAVMLEQYEIGHKVRSLRLRKKMGLVELGRHTSLSPSLLSKIERGRVCPPLGTLLRIAMVFSVGLDYFFAEEREKPVVAISRAADRRRFPDNPQAAQPSFFFESLDFGATDRASSSFLAHFERLADDEAEPHVHDGHETLYVMTGELEVTIGGSAIVLSAGDALYFDSAVPHSYRRLSDEPCSAVVTTVP